MRPVQPSAPLQRLPDAVLRPTVGNVFETTVEQLATAIRLGVFVTGEQLPPERELADRLGVARNTLRDAIAALRASGLVSTRRGRGGGSVVTYSGEWSRSAALGTDGVELDDALEFRRIVEPGACRLAARTTLTPDQRRWLSESAQAARGAQGDARRIADSRLHLAIATLTGSPMVVQAVTRAQAALGELLAAIPVLARNIEHSHDQHDAVVAAVLDGDGEAARTSMEEHCDATSALLRGLIG